MKWLKNIFRSTEQPTKNEKWLNGEVAPMELNQQDYFTLSTVHTCIKLLSETIASLPLHTFREVDGDKQRVDNSISYMLEERPNPYISDYEFKKQIIVNLCIYGNAYVWIERDSEKKPINLWVLQNASPELNFNTGKIIYRTTLLNGEPKIFNYMDIIHIKGLSIDGLNGISPLKSLQDNLLVSKKVSELLKSYYSKNLFGSVILKFDAMLNDELLNNVGKKFSKVYRSNNFGLIPLGGGTEVIPFPTKSLKEFELTESQKYISKEIANVFGIPLGLLGFDGIQWNNVEQLYLMLIKNIEPLCTGIEKETSFKLYKQRRTYCKFNFRKLLKADIKTQAEYLKTLVDGNIMTIDEARTYLDLPKREEIQDGAKSNIK